MGFGEEGRFNQLDDSEIAACVARAVGGTADGATVSKLSGRQGLLVCRVTIPRKGSYIFKAVRESLRREIALTVLLARLSHGATPAVIAEEQDHARGLYWIILEDLGARRLSDEPTVEGYAHAAEVLAGLQIHSMDWVDCLAEAGLRTAATFAWEEVALRALVAVTEGAVDGLVTGDDFEPIAWSVTELTNDASFIPPALIHGDLHAGNIAVKPDGEACLLDWGSAFVGPAFLGLEELLLPAQRHLKRQADQDRVRATYLRQWGPILGKPGPLECPLRASQTLVRLQVFQSMVSCGAGAPDPYAAASAFTLVRESWRAWRNLT